MRKIVKYSKKSLGLLFFASLLVSNIYVASGYQLRQPSITTKVWPKLAQEKHDGNVRKISKAPTCPDAAVINPCSCDINSDNTEISLFCESISSDAELANIFQQEFPQNDFNILYIAHSTLEALTPGIFSGKTFKEITIWASGLQRVEVGALSSSYSTLKILRLNGNRISQFPFEDSPLFTSLIMLELSYNGLISFPSLVSSSLEIISLEGNSIGSIPVDGFKQVPMVQKIFLGSNGITEVLPGTFTGLPQLYSLWLNNNSLSELLTGTVELHDTDSYLFFHENAITKVEVNAFTGAALQVVANSNSLAALEEEVWRPTLETSADVLIESNPLLCGCDIAWILRNPDFLVHVFGTCSDGTAIQELDPADFAQC